jgi:hypothetical protein
MGEGREKWPLCGKHRRMLDPVGRCPECRDVSTPRERFERGLAKYRNQRRAEMPRGAPSVEATIGFGHFKGRTFNEIFLRNPGYLRWMLQVGAGTPYEHACARLALKLNS